MKYWIRSIETTGGVFKDAGKIVWKPGVTVVIGPRGSFKSTKLQLVNVCLACLDQVTRWLDEMQATGAVPAESHH